MSSRQEEKERLRAERVAREQAAAKAEKRRRLLQVGGAVALLAAVAVALVVLLGGGSDDDGAPSAAEDAVDIPAVAIPARRTEDLDAAVKAAGCTLTHPPIEGAKPTANHVDPPVTYKTNPPTSGDHLGTPASDGSYAGGETPVTESLVHSLEHGRIQIQYKPGTPIRQIGQLESVFAEDAETDFGLAAVAGGFAQLFENRTGMTYALAAAAWGHLLGCDAFNDRVFDAIRAFRTKYTLQAPEQITQAQ